MKTISDTLRQAIADSDTPYLALERATGVSRGSISRFVNGERDLYLWSASALAQELGLELVPRKRGKK